MPRPTLLNAETHGKITDGLKIGLKRHEAAAIVGITDRTLYSWIARGKAALERWQEIEEHDPDVDLDAVDEDPDFVYRMFYLDVLKADAIYKRSLVSVLTRAAVGAAAEYDERGNMIREEVVADPKVALAVLERKDPREWGRTHRVPSQRQYEQEQEEAAVLPDDEALRAMALDKLDEVAQKRAQREAAGL